MVFSRATRAAQKYISKYVVQDIFKGIYVWSRFIVSICVTVELQNGRVGAGWFLNEFLYSFLNMYILFQSIVDRIVVLVRGQVYSKKGNWRKECRILQVQFVSGYPVSIGLRIFRRSVGEWSCSQQVGYIRRKRKFEVRVMSSYPESIELGP